MLKMPNFRNFQISNQIYRSVGLVSIENIYYPNFHKWCMYLWLNLPSRFRKFCSLGSEKATTTDALNLLQHSSENIIEFLSYVAILFYNVFEVFLVMYFGNEIMLSSDRLSYYLSLIGSISHKRLRS